jgi:hypothetical protein
MLDGAGDYPSAADYDDDDDDDDNDDIMAMKT